MKNIFKGLFDPKKHNHQISIDNQETDVLKNMLNKMILIRKTEQKLAFEKKKWINYWACTP